MKILNRHFIGLLILSLCAAATDAPKAETQVTLDIRKESGPYKNSAYSFRRASADVDVHHNYVDLLFDNCGSLHVKMVNHQENRICDLGKVALKDAADSAPDDATWFVECVKPEQGHVYLEEIKQNGQTMTVKFSVDELKDDTVKFTWVTVKALDGPDDSDRGAAGTKGLCGGGPEKNR